MTFCGFSYHTLSSSIEKFVFFHILLWDIKLDCLFAIHNVSLFVNSPSISFFLFVAEGVSSLTFHFTFWHFFFDIRWWPFLSQTKRMVGISVTLFQFKSYFRTISIYNQKDTYFVRKLNVFEFHVENDLPLNINHNRKNFLWTIPYFLWVSFIAQHYMLPSCSLSLCVCVRVWNVKRSQRKVF